MSSELLPGPSSPDNSSSTAVTLQLLPSRPTRSPAFEHSHLLFGHIPFIYSGLATDPRWPTVAQQRARGEPRCRVCCSSTLQPSPPFLFFTPHLLRKNKPLLLLKKASFNCSVPIPDTRAEFDHITGFFLSTSSSGHTVPVPTGSESQIHLIQTVFNQNRFFLFIFCICPP